MEKEHVTVCTVLAETSPQALPLGAACIVSAIKKRFLLQNTVDKTIELTASLLVFSNEDILTAKDLAQKIILETPTVVCFSLFVWNRPLLEETARLLRKYWKENMIRGFIIAGGPEVTADPNQFFLSEYDCASNCAENEKCFLFDFVCSGPGEKAVPDLLEKIFFMWSKRPALTIKDRIVYGTEREFDSSISPYLDQTLDPDTYGGVLWELARGCPFKCSYCYESKGSKILVYFPMERIRKEIDYFALKKVPQVFVLDPTYNADKKRALEMIGLIKEKLPETFFHFECRAEYIDMPLARAFASIPCSLQIGLQSSSEKVLALVNRPFNRKQFTRKVALLNETGCVFGFDLIYGLPGDTLGGFKESIDYAISLYPNHIELFRLSVLPGTDLFDRAEALELVFDHKPPYLVSATPSFSEKNLHEAEKLARSCNLFYSQGRAVSWFTALLKPLKMSPSGFFTRFSTFCDDQNIKPRSSFSDIEALQKQWIRFLYHEKKLTHLLAWAEDMISLFASLSFFAAEGKDSTITLHYKAEDLLDPLALDGVQFTKMARQGSFRVRTSDLS